MESKNVEIQRNVRRSGCDQQCTRSMEKINGRKEQWDEVRGKREQEKEKVEERRGRRGYHVIQNGRPNGRPTCKQRSNSGHSMHLTRKPAMSSWQ